MPTLSRLFTKVQMSTSEKSGSYYLEDDSISVVEPLVENR